jgi:PAS domain S-box-containing protein
MTTAAMTMARPTRPALLRYGSVLTSSTLALLLSLVLDPLIEASSLSFFLAAVAFSAWYGGLWPGLLATLVGVLASSYFLLSPSYSLAIATVGGAVQLLVFALVAVLISTLNANLLTARHLAEAAEARYRGLFERAADAILLTDEQGHCLDANAAAEQLFGYTPAELRQKRMRDLAAHPTADGKLPSGEWQRELEMLRKDGSVVPVEARARTTELPTSNVQIAVLRDISERRALERLQREFIEMVTHDLRSPLTSIVGYAQFMRRRGAYNGRAIEVIISQSSHLNRLIGDLLDVSRLEAGRLGLRVSDVDLATLVRASAEQAQGLSDLHTVRVETASQPVVGQWDEGRLTQVLQNLLSNAIKYSPSGEILLRLEDQGLEARVSVTDYGPGIAADALPHLFERFFRANAAAASEVRGLGLGLYISKSIVEAHGGHIWAQSEPGRGSTFSFTLPYR